MRRTLTIAALVSLWGALLAGCAAAPEQPAQPDDDKQAQAFSTYLSGPLRRQ